MSKLLDVVKGRKSVRTFDGRNISDEHKVKLQECIKEISNPFDIPVDFVFINAKENGLSSPVLSGEEEYVAVKVAKKPYADVAFGYSFEKFILYAWTLGIGTVMIGGTMKREAFEEAAGLKDGEMMPCMSPLGYPAPKRSIKELMMRKGIGADTRKPFSDLFFADTWNNPLNVDPELQEVFEMVQWAPSAVNKQPWRIVAKDGLYHFYEKKDKGYVNDNTGDLQKIDLGIAICHFVMGLEEMGKKTTVAVSDPGVQIPEDAEYIASVCFE